MNAITEKEAGSGMAGMDALDVLHAVEEGWGMHLEVLGCAQCGQAHLAAVGGAGEAVCPACGRGQLERQPVYAGRLRREPPELVLPFQRGRAALNSLFESFVRPLWLAPDDFKMENLVQRAVPLWMPMWLVDSDVQGEWQAQAGFDYQVKSSQEFFAQGRWQTREVIEPRVRWEDRRGSLVRRYENVAVPAMVEHARLVEGSAGYDLRTAVPYQPAVLQGAWVRIPDVERAQAWEKAQPSLERKAAADCQAAAGAGHMRQFTLQAAFERQNWTQILLPGYFTWYRDDEGKAHPVFVNGQNGQVRGVRMASQRRGWRAAGLLAGLAGLAFVLALLCFAFTALLPPLSAVGALLVIAAFGLGVGAVVPAVWPWQWNRRELF
jgi:hypothetical protein